MHNDRNKLLVMGLASLVIALVVLAAGTATGPIVQAVVLALAVTGLAAALFLGSSARGARRESPLGAQPEPGSASPLLDERGITIKLIEMMALCGRYGNPLSVALVGVDHWARLKDQYGPEAAERAAGAIAEVLTEALRMPDHVGRLDEGGFLIVLPETTLRGARQIGERIRRAAAVTEVPVDPRRRVALTVSIGVSLFRDGDDLEQLLTRVQKVLAQAKTQGRNRVIVDLAA
ncbi:MAG: GGDEF domain-containing protein [Gammaproteobacteria bacterium]|nr:GGDEF domain-containing protein [Gammaproteobacteria bacterium]